jgi:hypothetical protein
MAVKEFDQFLTAEVVPLLKELGFRRRRREFVLDGPNGVFATLGFYPEQYEPPRFGIQYGVHTPSYVRRKEQQSDHAAEGWPTSSAAPVLAQVFAPDPINPVMVYQWSIGEPEDRGRVGEQVRTSITEEIVPTIQRWFDPHVLAEEIRPQTRPGVFARGASVPLKALVLIDAIPPIEAATLLEGLDDYPRTRDWIEAELQRTGRLS